MKTIISKPFLVYGAVVLLLLGPLLLPGYILTLDMVFTPQLPMPPEVTSSYLWHVLLHGLNMVLPADLIQKLMLLVILILTGLGAHRLAQQWKLVDGPLLYTAGLLYMVNPFTYERFMSGQYNVLFGYALLPWFAAAVVQLASRPEGRMAAKLIGWALLISVISIHSIVPAALLALLIVGRQLVRMRARRQSSIRLVQWCAVVVGLWLVSSAYWLVPLATGNNSQAELIGSFSQQDNQAFATGGNGVAGQLANVMRLQGFWPERYGMFVLPQDHLPLLIWALLMATMVCLAGIGLVALWRQGSRGLPIILAAIVAIGAMLGAGIGNSWWTQLPLLAGYREPQKFVMLVALAYALLAPIGLAAVLRYADRRKQEVVSGALLPFGLALPFLIALPYIWGGNGQLQATDYPASWYTVNRNLVEADVQGKTLSLPWHLYAHSNFAGRIIANPAPKFFDVPMVVSGDPELEGAAYNNPTVTSKQLDTAIKRAKNSGDSKDFTATLAKFGIQYVVLTKEADYQRYGFLDRQTGLERIADYNEISLYRVRDYKPSVTAE